MHRKWLTGIIAALGFAVLAGCTEERQPEEPRDKDGGIRIRAPGVDVDVERKGRDGKKKVDVDVDVDR